MLISRAHVTSYVFYRPEKSRKLPIYWLALKSWRKFYFDSAIVLQPSLEVLEVSWKFQVDPMSLRHFFRTFGFLQYMDALMTSSANFRTAITSGGMAKISWNLVYEFSWNRCMHVPDFVALPCVKEGYPQGGLHTPLSPFMDRQVKNTFMDEGLRNIRDVSLVSDFIT